jgi:protein-S-isoprenylcysteine O-methyltransferase Ste14
MPLCSRYGHLAAYPFREVPSRAGVSIRVSNATKDNTVNPARRSPGKLVFGLASVLIYPALLLYLSGDWLWLEGWIFSVWFIALCATLIVYPYLRDPGLFAERHQRAGTRNQKSWDRYVLFGLFLNFLASVILMPLDAKRYGWTAHFPLWLKVLGGMALLSSFFFIFRSFTDNTFLSAVVRIQRDRKQQLVSTGVYGFVRHPMYLGTVLLSAGAPMLLGSRWGIGLSCLGTLLVAGRIVGEERTLTAELDGYSDYQKQVRYRLIPFVW